MKIRVHAPLSWLPLGLAVVVLAGWGATPPATAQIGELPDQCARALPCCPTPTQVVTYEELVACGFYPQETRLECIVNVKQPSCYGVYRDMVPPSGPRTSNAGVGVTTTQTNGPTYRARAILSWDTAPTGCSFVPQFGNVLNFPIRLDPIR